MWKKTVIDRRPATTAICLAVFLALGGTACRGKHNVAAVQNEEEESDAGPRLFSTVRMNDTEASAQLLKGFYGVEGGAWRWTSGHFSVLLRTPPGAAQNGGTVSLAFNLPDAVITQIKSVKLTASVNGMVLTSEEYTRAGSQTLSADVPASQLGTDSVKVDFALDKTLPPSVDKRELGVIATSVALAAK